MAKHKRSIEIEVPEIKHLWHKQVEENDYHAALAFLSLKVGTRRAKALVKKLRSAEIVPMRANDILRASALPALDMTDPGTHRNMIKTIEGRRLSPILVVTFANGTSTIADGYHRVSWAYQISPWVLVPGKLATEE